MKKLLFLVTIAAKATTVYFDSSAATINSSGQATVDLSGALNPNPDWATALPGSSWISYGPTGASSDPGYFSPADGTEVTFTTQFMLSGAITSASLTVLADDSTSVILNGTTLIYASTSSPCPGPAGCVSWTTTVLNFAELAPYLVDGTNTLSFGVVQLGGQSYGLDFAGSVNPPTPEPSTVLLMAAGLFWLALVRKKQPPAASSGNLRTDAR